MSKLQFAKDAVKEAEEIGIENLKSLAELKEWARNYNSGANEGGEGYVPDVMAMMSLDKYEWALKIIAELEPVEEIEIIEEVVEVVEEEIVEVSNAQSIMVNAWEIAREGAAQFGGKASEHLSESMKIAWADHKKSIAENIERIEEDLNSAMAIMDEIKPSKVEISLSLGSRKHKSWLAKINGPHPKFKLDREFVKEIPGEEQDYEVGNGIYEVCNGGDRYFIEVENGAYIVVSDGWVYDQVA